MTKHVASARPWSCCSKLAAVSAAFCVCFQLFGISVATMVLFSLPAEVSAQDAQCDSVVDCVPEFIETPRTPGTYSVCFEHHGQITSNFLTSLAPAIAYWNAKNGTTGVTFGTISDATLPSGSCNSDFTIKVGNHSNPNVPGWAFFDTKEIYLDQDFLQATQQPNWDFVLGHELGHQLGLGDVEDCQGHSAMATGVSLSAALPSTSSCPDINAAHQGYSNSSTGEVEDWVPMGAWDCWEQIFIVTLTCTRNNVSWICGQWIYYSGQFQCGGDPLPD